jgi:hypothetical protein
MKPLIRILRAAGIIWGAFGLGLFITSGVLFFSILDDFNDWMFGKNQSFLNDYPSGANIENQEKTPKSQLCELLAYGGLILTLTSACSLLLAKILSIILRARELVNQGADLARRLDSEGPQSRSPRTGAND